MNGIGAEKFVALITNKLFQGTPSRLKWGTEQDNEQDNELKASITPSFHFEDQTN